MNAKGQVERMLRGVRSIGFNIHYWDGERVSYGDAAPVFTLSFPDPATLKWILGDVVVRMPEAYVSGRVRLEGGLQHLLHLGYQVDERILRLGPWRKAALGLTALLRRNSPSGARANVSHHYDLSNEFFSLWLDGDMSYSCAYFEKADDDLESAQRQKLRHLCAKLRLERGQRLLDIGCGWGALAMHAAKEHGVRVVGITLSEPQRSLAHQRVKERGLEALVDVRLCDYRELGKESFDRIVSVGMIEHVGSAYLRTYMQSVARSLRPGGIAVLHTMGKTQKASVTPWITKRIFPGMYLPTLAELSAEMADAGLRISDVENLRPHYALTIDAWIERFERKADAVAAMFDERFVRMWRMYLHTATAAFRLGELNVWQTTCSRGFSGEIPLTRRSLYC